MNKFKGKLLGIDYGDTRIGVAVCDFDQTIAFGRTVIHNKSTGQVINELKKICNDEKIIEIVIGLPLSMDGSETEQTEKVKKFKHKLENIVNLPVRYQDERLTTAESDVILTSINFKGRRKFKEKDIVSASIILQNYIDKKGKGGR